MSLFPLGYVGGTMYQTRCGLLAILENGDTAAGILGPNVQRSISVGKYPTIFQTEVKAMLICCKKCIILKTKGKRFYVKSGSYFSLPFIMRISKQKRFLANNSHQGHVGGERSDCLANVGRDIDLKETENHSLAYPMLMLRKNLYLSRNRVRIGKV